MNEDAGDDDPTGNCKRGRLLRGLLEGGVVSVPWVRPSMYSRSSSYTHMR